MPQREFGLLRVLVERAGRAVSREELLNQVWKEGLAGYPRTLNAHIYRLRQKLEDEPTVPRLIETVRSYGSCFVGHGGSLADGYVSRATAVLCLQNVPATKPADETAYRTPVSGQFF